MTYTGMYTALPDPDSQPAFYEGVLSKRLLAWVVDVLVISALTALAVLATFLTGLFFLPVLYAVISFLYRWVTLSRSSATLGMQLFSVEFRTRDGAPFDAMTAALHTGGYVASCAIFPLQLVSIALMLVSGRGQGLTDHVLGTVLLNRAA